ncbi:hypothetical protein O5D80_004300 [Batrachochytrium dendrobatidis]|nr:hypothetical protein O5D80_004300 [Batrachochytrium dendrobatidis]
MPSKSESMPDCAAATRESDTNEPRKGNTVEPEEITPSTPPAHEEDGAYIEESTTNSKRSSVNIKSRRQAHAPELTTSVHNQHVDHPPHVFEARRRIKNLGVMGRSPMGEYISTTSPLSQLAVPTPGPLDYEPKLYQSGVQYSILGKHAAVKEEKINIGPGPSKYDVRPILLPYCDAPHWSFGHKLADQKVKNDTPSPFAYTDTHNAFGKNNLSYTMSGRFSHSENETPGPDRYLPRSEFGPTGIKPKYSFGLKSFTIEDSTPGPLDYSIPSCPPDAVKGPSFTMRRRLDDLSLQKDTKPGPNEYYPKLPASEKMASLKGMHKETKSLKTPGPANYIIPANISSGPHYTLIARNIPYQDSNYIGPYPGPTDYNPEVKLTFSKGPTFSLGVRPKSSKNPSDDIPGPNAYHPLDRQIRGNRHPKVTIKGRRSTTIDVTPGPADYNSHTQIASPTVAQLARNSTLSKAGANCLAERIKSKVVETPGPADYQLKPALIVKKSGPKYSPQKHTESQKVNQTPGPNAYYIQPKKNGGYITMKSRPSPFVMVFPSNRINTLRV